MIQDKIFVQIIHPEANSQIRKALIEIVVQRLLEIRP